MPKSDSGTSARLTHVDESGNARMVDVGNKPMTDREAVARGRILMRPETLALINSNGFDKGDVLGVARIAGIMAAKNTSTLVPLCHPLPLSQVMVDFELHRQDNPKEFTKAAFVDITATVRTTAKTGVEMEAMTAVSIAALTIYDMCKKTDRGMILGPFQLLEKFGGASGLWRQGHAETS